MQDPNHQYEINQSTIMKVEEKKLLCFCIILNRIRQKSALNEQHQKHQDRNSAKPHTHHQYEINQTTKMKIKEKKQLCDKLLTNEDTLSGLSLETVGTMSYDWQHLLKILCRTLMVGYTGKKDTSPSSSQRTQRRLFVRAYAVYSF